jgi:hypothetical protein
VTSCLPAFAQEGQIGRNDALPLSSFGTRETFGKLLCCQKAPDGGTTDAQCVGNGVVTQTLPP